VAPGFFEPRISKIEKLNNPQYFIAVSFKQKNLVEALFNTQKSHLGLVYY